MKTRLLLLAALVLVLSSCMRLKVVQQYDEAANFANYKTFNFLGWLGDTDGYVEVDTKAWEKALTAQLEGYGLKKVDTTGDVSISLFIVIDRQTTTNRYNNYYGASPYGYTAPGWGWNTGYGYNPTYPSGGVPYKENAYLQGTLVVDIFSNQTKTLVYQAVASKAISPDRKPNRDAIPGMAKKLMKKYPAKVSN